MKVYWAQTHVLSPGQLLLTHRDISQGSASSRFLLKGKDMLAQVSVYAGVGRGQRLILRFFRGCAGVNNTESEAGGDSLVLFDSRTAD